MRPASGNRFNSDLARLVGEQPQQHPSQPEDRHRDAEQRADAGRGVERAPVVDRREDAGRHADHDGDEHGGEAELHRRGEIRAQFLRHRQVVGERPAEVAVQGLPDVREVLHVPRLIELQIVRETDDVGVRGVLAEQNLDWISRNEVQK